MYRVVQAGTRFPNLPLLPPFRVFFFVPLFISAKRASERRKSGNRLREKEARDTSKEEANVGGEARGVPPSLSFHRQSYLLVPPPRDSGPAEHYNSGSPLAFSLQPFLPSSSSSLLLHSRYLSPSLATADHPLAPPTSVDSQLQHDEMQGHAAPLLASKTVLDPRATLHTIRERHGVASLWPTLPLVQHVVTTDVTRRTPSARRSRRHENLRARTQLAPKWYLSRSSRLTSKGKLRLLSCQLQASCLLVEFPEC